MVQEEGKQKAIFRVLEDKFSISSELKEAVEEIESLDFLDLNDELKIQPPSNKLDFQLCPNIDGEDVYFLANDTESEIELSRRRINSPAPYYIDS